MRDTRTTKDGFVGGESLVRLSGTEWSVHHLESGGDVKEWETERRGTMTRKR